MTPPRHLWSGDWRRESAEAARQLADRRGPTEAPIEPPPAGPSVARPSRLDRALAALRSIDPGQVRRTGLLGIAMLLAAGAAYAGVSALRTSSTHASGRTKPTSARGGAPAWLGVDVASLPLANGAMIVDVAPGSPADTAGLQPGDVITEIGSHPVQSSADVDSVLGGLHPGQHVRVVYQRGPLIYTAQVTLKAQRSGP